MTKVHLRADLKEEGLRIPCNFQDGFYLAWDDIEHADFIGRIDNDQSLVVLLLAPDNGFRSLALVDSIDLDWEEVE